MKPSLIFLSIVLAAAAAIPPNPTNQSLVVTHVTVIDMTSTQPKPDQTVVIEGNRIVAIGKSSEVSIPSNSRVVNATGKFLIPGLWDMHAHTVYDRARDTERTLFKCSWLMESLAFVTWGALIRLNKSNRGEPRQRPTS